MLIEVYPTSDGYRSRICAEYRDRGEADHEQQRRTKETNAVFDEIAGLRRQRDELHETANRYLERARLAEGHVTAMYNGWRIGKDIFGPMFLAAQYLAKLHKPK